MIEARDLYHEMRAAGEEVRLDRWLWAARFFKTRSLAAGAVEGGKVHVGGNRVKPSRRARIGDEITVRKGPYEFVVVVRGLSQVRGPAEAARRLYEETEESRGKRDEIAAALRATAPPAPEGRPTKRERRDLLRLRRGKG